MITPQPVSGGILVRKKGGAERGWLNSNLFLLLLIPVCETTHDNIPLHFTLH